MLLERSKKIMHLLCIYPYIVDEVMFIVFDHLPTLLKSINYQTQHLHHEKTFNICDLFSQVTSRNFSPRHAEWVYHC